MFGGRLGHLTGQLVVTTPQQIYTTSKPDILQSEMSSITKLPIYQYTSEDLEVIYKNVETTLNYGKDILDEVTNSRTIEGIQKGGVITLKNYSSAAHAFDFFIKHSQIKVLPPSSIAARNVILTLNDGVVSPYRDYSASTFTNPTIGDVRQLIVKFVIVGSNITNTMDRYNTEIQSLDSIREECKITNQTAILTANLDINAGRYEKASPYIVFYAGGDEVPNNNSTSKNQVGIDINNPVRHPDKYSGAPDLESTITKLFNDSVKEINDPIKEGQRSWSAFKENLTNRKLGILYGWKQQDVDVRLGVIAMTLAPGKIAHEQLDSMQDNTDKNNTEKNYLYVALLLEVIRTVIFTGYLHGDLHAGNFFIEDIPDTLEVGRRVSLPYNKRVTLIDFGRTLDPWTDTLTGKERTLTYSRSQIIENWNNMHEKSINYQSDILRFLLYDVIGQHLIDLSKLGEVNNTMSTIFFTIMELGINDSKGNMNEGTITELNNYYKACVTANSDNKTRINEISRQTGLIEPPPYLKESGYVLSETDYTDISQKNNSGLVKRIFSFFTRDSKDKKAGIVRDLSIGRSNLSLLSNTRVRKLYSKYHKIKKMKYKSRTTRKYRNTRTSRTTRKYRNTRTSRN